MQPIFMIFFFFTSHLPSVRRVIFVFDLGCSASLDGTINHALFAASKEQDQEQRGIKHSNKCVHYIKILLHNIYELSSSILSY